MTEALFASDVVGVPVLGPLVGALLVLAVVLPRLPDALASRVALGGAVLHLGATLALRAAFVEGTDALQLAERGPTLPLVGASWHLAVDGVSVLFLPLLSLLYGAVVLHAWHRGAKHLGAYLGTASATAGLTLGALCSVDVLLFWAFLTAEIVPSARLMRGWGHGARRDEAAARFTAFAGVGSALLLAGIAMLPTPASGGRFDLPALLATPFDAPAQSAAFFLMFLGLMPRLPLFPFHTWLPLALEHGAVVGAGTFFVGVKLGAFALMRFVWPLAPIAAHDHADLVRGIAVVSIVYGALVAMVQTNLRRLLAFAALSHIGAVVLGLTTQTVAGYEGALLGMLNLGLATAGLYFATGFLVERTGSADQQDHGGLLRAAPLLSLAFLVLTLASIGMPGTIGFDAEHLLLEGAVEQGDLAVAFAIVAGTFLTAAYLIGSFQRSFFGASSPRSAAPRDLDRVEGGILGALVATIVGVGLFAGPALHAMEASVTTSAARAPHPVHREHPDAPPHANVHPEGSPEATPQAPPPDGAAAHDQDAAAAAGDHR